MAWARVCVRVCAERPAPPSNCSVWNHTGDSLLVGCLEGGAGATAAAYVLELLELPGMAPLENVSASAGVGGGGAGGGGGQPVFEVRGLRPGVSYSARVYAVGERGRSSPVVVQPLTYKHVAKFVGEEHHPTLPPSSGPPPPLPKFPCPS
ncbi:hypothetical protein PR048_019403 [Dryococelus australis]|uniref:Fibronectin type-III domain-containing protein n=1 Tax=Dryococelus australis TaxID=614101 RepID=A0ABQ9H3I6_9NEOP|nr:hypothetical protein PR048_019403 [Dryococelus australis]